MWFSQTNSKWLSAGANAAKAGGRSACSKVARAALDHPDADPRRWWHGILIPSTPTPHEGTRALKILPWRWVSCRAVCQGFTRPARFGAVAVLMTKPRRIAQAGRVLETSSVEPIRDTCHPDAEPRQVLEARSLLLARATLRRAARPRPGGNRWSTP